MDEELVETDVPSVGERLRAAREEKGLSLEDIAAQTRIPRRHLESIEAGDWDRLPAPTYTIGFARSYASRRRARPRRDRRSAARRNGRPALADHARRGVRAGRPGADHAQMARSSARSLAVIVLVLVMSWLNRRSLEQPDE